jgi:glycosyltransferase involved in cell wall biosynthesis
MTEFSVDIVIPIWNAPADTRSCLVSLAEHAPQARLILVDHGSERETERLLEEFAEMLDRRALLVRTDRNPGFVKSANLGLKRGEAPVLGLVRSSTVVTAGWLAPLLTVLEQGADIGVVVPRCVDGLPGKHGAGRKNAQGAFEIDHASFGAMILKKELFARIGGFDDTMDAGLWCLKDYSRRAWGAGYRTLTAPGGTVCCRDEMPLGSEVRRRDVQQRSRDLYRERWGEELTFCLLIPRDVEVDAFHARHEMLLDVARRGHVMTVLLPSALYRQVRASGSGHENIRYVSHPRFFAERWLGREIVRMRGGDANLLFVRWRTEDPFPGGEESMSLDEAVNLTASGAAPPVDGHRADREAVRTLHGADEGGADAE